MRKISFAWIAMLVILLSTSMVVSAGAKSKDANKANESRMRALYEDKVRFEMLSSAAQMVLERKFGSAKGPAGNAVPGIPRKASQSPLAALPNVLVNNPAADATDQDTQSETTIVLAGPNIVAGFNDSGSFLGGEFHFTGWSYSTDGGATWTDQGQLPDSVEGDAGDPVLARNDTTGRIYFTTLGFNTSEVLQSFRSDDNGVSFMAPIPYGFTNPGDFQDKEWIAVDNFVGAGQGNVYSTWRSFGDGIYFVRSTDNGATFSAPAQLASQGSFNVQGAFVAVAPDHSVHVFWLDQSAGSGTPNIVRTRKSTDGGVTFAAFVTVATRMNTGVNGGLGLNGGFRTNGFPHVAINPVSGHIYAVFADDVAGADAADVFLSRSTDGGATWIAPLNVSDLFDSTTNDDFSPTVAVTSDGNNLLMTWYDRQVDPANSLIDYFGAIADVSAGGLAFGNQFRISTENFPVVIGQDPVINTVYMGDYDQAVADTASFHTTWGDNRDGNSFHTNQPDVRSTTIPVAGPGAILALGAVTTDDSAGNNNGEVDFNECIGMNVVLTNFGSSTATGVSATLSTTTPNVNVTSAISAYPDIAPGGSQTNSTPFQFETTAVFVCGTPIDFTLNVTTTSAGGGANFSFSFTIQTGGVGPTSQYDNNTPTPIVDGGTVDIPITVAGFTGNIGEVTVSFHTTHTWDGDLDISLIAPNGDEVELSTDNGGLGDNYGTNCSSRTVFDDDAATAITAGVPPFVGTFRPEGLLSDFVGKTGTDVNGTWLLRFTDDFLADFGTIQCSSLFLSPTQCTDGGGPCGAGCANPPTITTTTLPNGAEGVAYNQTVQATGGTPPYTWSVSVGTLPPGLLLDSATGVISGTPTAGSAGTYNFTVMVIDTVPGCSDTQDLSITIDVAPACTYEDLFDDSVLTWTQVKPVVTEVGGNLNLAPTNKKAYATSDPVFAGIQNGTITAEIMFTTNGELKEKGTMLTHWIDKKTLVEIQFNIAKGKVIVKQKADGVLAKDNGLFAFAFNTLYTVTANYDGTDYEVSIDGTPVVTLTPVGTIPSGIIGFTARGLNELVNRVCVTP